MTVLCILGLWLIAGAALGVAIGCYFHWRETKR